MTATEDIFTSLPPRAETTATHRLLEDANLSALRNVLLAQERAQLKTIHYRLDDPATRAAEVARVLPAAIALRIAENSGEALCETLAPVVRSALAGALRENPDLLVSAVRRAIGQSLLAPWRSCAAILRRRLRRRTPARITHLYLLDRRTGSILEQAILPPPPPDAATDDTDTRATFSMITYLLAFLRDPEHLAGYAALKQLRIDRLTYGIFAGAGKILLAVIDGDTDIAGRLHYCEELLINAEQGAPLPALAV